MATERQPVTESSAAPGSSATTSPPQHVSIQLDDHSVVQTGGGDYAEGNIDNRSGTFFQGTNIITVMPSDPLLHDPDRLTTAQKLLAKLPLNTIPPQASLPFGRRILLRANPLFVGRKQELRALARAIKGDETSNTGYVRIVAVTGLGGMGKTQLASEFTHRYGQYFTGGVFWLNFAVPEEIPTEVADCRDALGSMVLADFDKLPLDRQVKMIQTAWQSPLPRLLIFDNCEKESLLKQWCPPTGGCRIIVTSRRAEWDAALGVQHLPLNILNRSASVALLCGGADLQTTDPHIQAIAEELGDLPLALDLARRSLPIYADDLGDYLAELRATPPIQHPTFQGKDEEQGEDEGSAISPTNHIRSVGKTFALSYAQLDPMQPIDNLAIKLLARAAYLASEMPVPHDVLLQTLALTKGDRRLAHQARRALKRLKSLGLIQQTEHNSLQLHGLLAEFIQTQIDNSTARGAVLHLLHEWMSSKTKPESERRAAAFRLLSMRWMSDTDSVPIDQLLIQLELIARYVDAPKEVAYLIECLTNALETTTDARQRLQLLVFLASMLGRSGKLSVAARKYDQGGRLLKQLIDSTNGKLDKEDRRLAARVNLGAGTTARHRAQKLTKLEDQERREAGLLTAKKCYQAAEGWARTYRTDPVLTTGIAMDLIYTYSLLEDWEAAERHYQEALEMLEHGKAHLKDHAIYTVQNAQLLETISQVHHSQGQSLAAKQCFPGALSAYQAAYEKCIEEIELLEKVFRELGDPVLIRELALAHINAGDSIAGMNHCPNYSGPYPISLACQHWNDVEDLATRFRIPGELADAQERLTEHCQSLTLPE
jgi:tetratricopeptide (TPR) repeat protein